MEGMVMPVVVGRNREGKEIVRDLAMTNVLLAGKSGSGKTKIASGIVASAKSKEPDIRVVLVDIKRVEAELYGGNVTEVVEDYDGGVEMLNKMCDEMDRRYLELAEAGVRNIAEYNGKEGKRMERIVVVIDEYADFMPLFGKRFETPLIRLAQKAYQVGIHLVMTTVRMSDLILTGDIKSCFLTMYCGEVGSVQKYDEREYEDWSREELIAEIWRLKSLIEDSHNEIGNEGGENVVVKGARLFVKMQRACLSDLLSHLGIGFARGGKIYDKLEQAGIIGKQIDSEPREVLVKTEEELERILVEKADILVEG